MMLQAWTDKLTLNKAQHDQQVQNLAAVAPEVLSSPVLPQISITSKLLGFLDFKDKNTILFVESGIL